MTMPLVLEVRTGTHVEVPMYQTHKSPRLLAVGEEFPLGVTNWRDVLLRALADFNLRLGFGVESTDEVFNSVEFHVFSVRPGARGRIACHGELVKSSCVQLADPNAGLAILMLDMDTGEVWITSQRVAYAVVTSVTLDEDKWGEYEPDWSVRMEWEGISTTFRCATRNYEPGDRVKVRIVPGTDRPHLAIM